VAVGRGAVLAVVEVAVELAQLPQLVRDVLARVGHGAVRADDDLVLVLRVGLHREDPAAGVLAFALQADRSRRLQQLEGALPEMQPQDVALAREQVVADAEPLHRRQVAVHDAGRDVGRELRVRVPAAFDGVQRLALQRLVLGTDRVEVGDAGVQVPAVVIELARDRLHVGERLLLDVTEADDDVGHLHARVVDVVLHPDLAPAALQHAHEGVAEHGVADVPDVRRLVGVDAGVLDDHRARDRRRSPSLAERIVQRQRERAAVEEQVDVAPARDLRPAHVAVGKGSGQLLADLAGLALQRLREVERRGQREVAERDVRRVLERHRPEVHVEGPPHRRPDFFRQPVLQVEEHRQLAEEGRGDKSIIGTGALPGRGPTAFNDV
jgi:hypothetical protein